MKHSSAIREREVLYFAGFDPRGARGYHQLYRQEAARQADAGGLTLHIGPRRRHSAAMEHWDIHAATASGEVHTRYRFMAWDDIVRRHWTRGAGRLLMESVRANAFQLWHGALWRAAKDRWPPVLAACMPVLLLALALIGFAFGVWGVAALLRGGVATWPWAALGASGAGLAAWAVHRTAHRFSLGWLTRSYAFNMRLACGQVPALDRRVRQHAQELVAASERLQGRGPAELLLVGHSSGAILAIAALAQALRMRPALARGGVRVSLLTLGQCIPMLGSLPQARSFREDLRAVAHCTDLDWLDFSAPPDGCCFALSDPLPTCGVARTPDEGLHRQPRLLSPRMARMFDAATYAKMRRDRHRMHFQYLMASERPVDYDYFRITADNQTLAARFAAQPDGGSYDGLRPWPWRRRRHG